MSAFQEDLREDFKTFLELDEWGEYAVLDGVLLQVQRQHIRTAQKSGVQSQNYDQLHGDFVKVFFRAEDYLRKRKRLPHEGDICLLNDTRFDVVSVKDDFGLIGMNLAAYRQNTPAAYSRLRQ